MQTFQQYLENTQGLLAAIRNGDRVAFTAYLDEMEERGEQIPEMFLMWRNLPERVVLSQVRWMINRDLPEALMIERFGTEHPWNENNIKNSLRDNSKIGNVIESVETIVGYMIYELEKDQLRLERLVVHPLFQRQGIGKKLIDKLRNKLSSHRRTRIVAEGYPPAMHGFFLKLGFMPINNTTSLFDI